MSPRRPRAPRALTALLLALVVGLPACGGDERPNVLFIVVDTLRADHLSTHGYGWETSPRLDALAERGAVFLDCTAQSSWTMPSMMSLMTGRPVFHTLWKLPGEMPVLGDHFRGHGWRTGAVVANSLLHHDNGYARGFESWHVRAESTPHWNAEEVNRRAGDFLAADDGRPWFLWLHYLDPHHPYEPPTTPWDRDNAEVFTEGELRTIAQVVDQAPAGDRERLSAQVPGLADVVDRYDGEIVYTDAQIGALLDRLEADGELENTLVVLVSDHGEGLFARPEHPDRIRELTEAAAAAAKNGRGDGELQLDDLLQDEHGYWMFQELIHTPFIVAGPGVAPGQRIEAMVSNLDVAPTVISLAGLPAMARLPGRDHAAALATGAPVAPADVVVSACYENQAARTPDGRKAILPLELYERNFGLPRLRFDLSSDPEERRPLPLDDVTKGLFEMLRDLREHDAFRQYSSNQADAETLRRLREMGYIRDGG